MNPDLIKEIELGIIPTLMLLSAIVLLFCNYRKKKILLAEQKSWRTSLAYGLLALALATYFIIYKDLSNYIDKLGLFLRVFTIILAVMAFSLAFLNFKRKSGNELYYAYTYNQHTPDQKISGITFYNAKDKAIVIFAIDICLMKSNEEKRIRFFQDNTNPIVITAYSSQSVLFDPISKYTAGFIPDRFTSKNSSCICESFAESIIAKPMNVKQLDSKFREKCIFPQNFIEPQENYSHSTVPINATHWITFIKSDIYYDEQYQEQEIDYGYIVMTGYFDNGVFYLTSTSTIDPQIMQYANGKDEGELDEMKTQTDSLIRNDYFNQVVDIGLIGLEQIKFKNINLIKR